MKIIFSLLLLGVSSYADQCQLLTEKQALEAKAWIEKTKMNGFKILEYCEPCRAVAPAVKDAHNVDVRKVADGELNSVIEVGNREIDLAYTYVQVHPKIWVNLSKLSTCSSQGVTKYLYESRPGKYKRVFGTDDGFVGDESKMVGKFVSLHDIVDMAISSKAECESNKGRWDDTTDGLCFFEGADEVEIKKSGGMYTATVENIGTNFHSCSFEAVAAEVIPGRLSFSAPTTIWDGDGKEKPAICNVTIEFKNNNTVNVSSEGYQECQEFCGANMFLYVGDAKRVR